MKSPHSKATFGTAVKCSAALREVYLILRPDDSIYFSKQGIVATPILQDDGSVRSLSVAKNDLPVSPVAPASPQTWRAAEQDETAENAVSRATPGDKSDIQVRSSFADAKSQHLSKEVTHGADQARLGDLLNNDGPAITEDKVNHQDHVTKDLKDDAMSEIYGHDDADDLDQVATPQRTQANRADALTPNGLRTTEATIRETPRSIITPSTVEADEHGETYSTARDEPGTGNNTFMQDSSARFADPESPSVKAALKPKTNESQETATAALYHSIDSTPSDEAQDGSSCNDEPQTMASVRPTPIEQEETGQAGVDDTIDPASTIAEDNARAGVQDTLNDDVSSDLLGPHELAAEAAMRSISQGSFKRKIPDVIDLDEDRGADELEGPDSLSNKRLRLDGSQDTSGSTVIDADTNSPELGAKSMSRRPGIRRPRKASKRPSEIGEVINVVPRKRSPQVIITADTANGTQTSSVTSSPLAGSAPKVLASTDSAAYQNLALKRWLRKMNVSTPEKIPSKVTSFVCVVPKAHKLKSAKVLHSLAMHKLVVTDDWLLDSMTADQLLDPADFVHSAVEATITHDRGRLLSGKRLFFTSPAIESYKRGWDDIQAIAKEIGASEVSKVPLDKEVFLRESNNSVFIGNDDTDDNANKLINYFNRTVYKKDFFTDSIIAAELLDDDSYKLHGSGTAKKARLR